MKKYLLVMLGLLFNIFVSAQENEKWCNELPHARPEKAAIFSGDVTAYFANQLLPEHKKGNHSAVFKLVVNCKGEAENIVYQDGSLLDKDKGYFADLIKAMVWKPAFNKSGKEISSIVFITIKIANGTLEVLIQ